MTFENRTNLEFSDVIDEILLSGAEFSADNLTEWIRKYPQFERELFEYARFEATVKHVPENDLTARQETSAAAPGNIKNIVERATQQSKTLNQEAMESLAAKAKERGLKFPQLAQKIGLSLPLLANLEQRFVRFASIPEQIFGKISEALDVSAETVKNYLQLPPALSTQASFKASDKPETPAQEDFFTLVERDRMLSPIERDELLKLKK